MNSDKYDPNGVGAKGTLFGLPFQEKDSAVVIVPVPWDATTSYHSGAAAGPVAILEASSQLDLEIANDNAPWKKGICMTAIDSQIIIENEKLGRIIEPYRKSLEKGKVFSQADQVIREVNDVTLILNSNIKNICLNFLKRDKFVGLLGGDHSCPLGYLQALSEKYTDFGILQIDAHMDLRQAYEGFEFSHASIMYNALKLPSVSKLVQVGIRDFCEAEKNLVESSNGRIVTYYDRLMHQQLFEGKKWQDMCQQIVADLPDFVYVSFDIDGLDPSLCPGTGTPVPGGLSYQQADYLLKTLKESGKTVIGFDLCEVAPQPNDQEWNANVGARVLYMLCGLSG